MQWMVDGARPLAFAIERNRVTGQVRPRRSDLVNQALALIGVRQLRVTNMGGWQNTRAWFRAAVLAPLLMGQYLILTRFQPGELSSLVMYEPF